MSPPSIVIASAGRTAVGSFNDAFGNTPAQELGAAVIKGVLEHADVEAGEVDEVILGQVLQASEGQNPARAMNPQEKTAWGMKQLCGSGLRAVALGMQQIVAGDADIIVAGGYGIDVDGTALRAPSRRREDGRLQDDRHDDQGRPDRRLLRLSHGHHRRERRPLLVRNAHHRILLS
ncbi:acetyl-CoA acetyltransferase [Rhizobium mesoamericanum]|nr:acetyl-CoA acetyltransferase [Rhizobium mesoamericanum]